MAFEYTIVIKEKDCAFAFAIGASQAVIALCIGEFFAATHIAGKHANLAFERFAVFNCQHTIGRGFWGRATLIPRRSMLTKPQPYKLNSKAACNMKTRI